MLTLSCYFNSILQAMTKVEAEKQGRQDATAAVMKLQAVIDMVREEMEASQAAYTRCDPELQAR